MPPIDYSKWDNIDTDSEPEFPPPQAPKPAPKPANKPAPAPAQATPAASPSDKKTVKAVTAKCTGEGGPGWSAITIPSDHPIFQNEVPPVPALLDLPVVIHRVGSRSNGQHNYLDNQPITYINIEADSGFAPPKWQSGIGTVIIARKDKKDLSPEHYEAIWMYCDYILDWFGEGPTPTHLYTRQKFEQWFRGYKLRAVSMGREEWNSVTPLY
ncbi:hypothetical protein N7466_008305 [Penicillium verhagenii]|uniref:uncharacterized protein n=1 Tax=Penicillium verhagenii TaxID=1562060 RepID=UPI002545399B|nr:uncharacterized protein N7466_008305 [Penicillium verhagenii]KAJ5924118.1 hypothetical protein N7466_008305 [Penicillium verhagenii]